MAESERPKSDTQEVQIIDADRLPELLSKLSGHPLYTRAIVSLFCGLRRGELLALRWRNVDLDRKIIKVREALEQTKDHGIVSKLPKTKAGKRDVTMPDIVIEALRSHLKSELELRMRLGLGKLSDDDWLFHTIDGKPMSPRRLSCSDWPNFVKSIGMPDITFHSLRHTHASQLIDAGINIVEISKRLGHSKPGVTLNVYSHLFRTKDDKAAAAINAALANFGSKTGC
jgi:integrase